MCAVAGVAVGSPLEDHAGGKMAIRIPFLLGATVVASLVLGCAGALADAGPGTQEHPIALHHPASVGGEWQMTVLSVTPNAEQAFGAGESCTGNPVHCSAIHVTPPAGAEGYMIGVSLRYLGAGSSSTETVVIIAIGSHDFPYPGQDCDRSDLVEGLAVFPGQAATGKVCFVIASNDATTLRLFVKTTPNTFQRSPSLLNPNIGKTLWFALH
jgi:hypothetical protein